MSKQTEKQLREENKALKEQLKASNEKLKAIDSGKLFYYIVKDGEVIQMRADVLPKEGSYAHWTGESGSKKLQVVGDFKKILEDAGSVTGYPCVRIKPLLKDMGFKYQPKEKTWSLPVAE